VHNTAVIQDLAVKLFWDSDMWGRRVAAVADEVGKRSPKTFNDYVNDDFTGLKTSIVRRFWRDKGLFQESTKFEDMIRLCNNVEDRALLTIVASYAAIDEKAETNEYLADARKYYSDLLSHIGGMVFAAATLVACDKKKQVGNSPNSVDSTDISKEIRNITQTLAAKSSDYGQSWRRHGLDGLCARLYDKIARYINLSRVPPSEIKNEPLTDSAKDMLGYAVITFAFVLEQLEVAIN
jgi:hypothetical protein